VADALPALGDGASAADTDRCACQLGTPGGVHRRP